MVAGYITVRCAAIVLLAALMAGCAWVPQVALLPERVEVLVEKPIEQECPKRPEVALPDIETVPPGASEREQVRIAVKNYIEMQGYAKQLKGTFGC